jgi:hypothetical protein
LVHQKLRKVFHNLNGENMASYILYIRTKYGFISRCAHIALHGYDSIDPYIHEQLLTDWPETKVFWERKDGYSTGLAPVSSSGGEH